jgi:hypothetical protein
VARDLDGDDVTDLAVLGAASDDVRILLGDGDGTFTPHPNPPVDVGQNPQALVAEDFDGGGDVELVVANRITMDLSVLVNAGVATYVPHFGSPIAVGEEPYYLAAGDLDADGAIDVVTSNTYAGTLSVLAGGGDGTFADPSSLEGVSGSQGLAIADLDGDGSLDIAVAQQNAAGIGIAIGHGDLGFDAPQGVAAGDSFIGVSTADLDQDGAPDLAAVGFRAGVHVLLSDP